ncbi:hypothetical protein TgHK011_005755 [Trichoderma gracile]|nr:hypothetical protein TgHK011_005755 [Trichoderma gracile]
MTEETRGDKDEDGNDDDDGREAQRVATARDGRTGEDTLQAAPISTEDDGWLPRYQLDAWRHRQTGSRPLLQQKKDTTQADALGSHRAARIVRLRKAAQLNHRGPIQAACLGTRPQRSRVTGLWRCVRCPQWAAGPPQEAAPTTKAQALRALKEPLGGPCWLQRCISAALQGRYLACGLA